LGLGLALSGCDANERNVPLYGAPLQDLGNKDGGQKDTTTPVAKYAAPFPQQDGSTNLPLYAAPFKDGGSATKYAAPFPQQDLGGPTTKYGTPFPKKDV
jgi:hypothetical protein